MAERTLAEIEADSGSPSWTTGTELESFVRFIATHGPYKTETLLYQQLGANDFKADDTVKSTLAHPLWCTVVSTSDRGNTTEGLQSAEVDSLESSSTFKTITLRDADGNNGFGVMITVYGY